MSRLSRWEITYRPGGWVHARAEDEETSVYLQLRRTEGGRWNAHVAAMESALPVSANVWRSVPFEAIERAATHDPNVLDCIVSSDAAAPVGLEKIGTYFAKSGKSEVRLHRSGTGQAVFAVANIGGRGMRVRDVQFDDDGTHGTSSVMIDPSGKMPALSDVRAIDKTRGVSRAPLIRPSGKITDDFLAELAAEYQRLVAMDVKAPAVEIAEETGAPVRTVHRWISIARKRNFLEGGRQGRVG